MSAIYAVCNPNPLLLHNTWYHTNLSSQAWREDNGINTLLTDPQPCFRIIKETYTHGVHCRARDGVTPIFIEHIGQFRNAYATLRKQDITDAQLLRHMLFVNEHLYGVTAQGVLPGGRVIKILDMSGASLGDIRGAAHRFSKEVGEVVDLYPYWMVMCWMCWMRIAGWLVCISMHASRRFPNNLHSLATSIKHIIWTAWLLRT